MEQKTLGRSAELAGVALHCGEQTRIVLWPAPAGTGVVFRRADLPAGDARDPNVRASPAAVSDARLGVRLANMAGVSVMTVEHLMAALALRGVDNAYVDVFGPELPILDGSAAPFLDMIDACGLVMQGAAKPARRIAETLRVEDGDRFVQIEPAEGRLFAVEVNFPDPVIGRQAVAFSLDGDAAAIEALATARTFCSLADVEAMRAAGFALGGSLANALVVDNGRLLNATGLRSADEFAWHKALDLVGDLSLVGETLIGRVSAYKPGHDLNTRLARAIAEMRAEPQRAPARGVFAAGVAAAAGPV